MGKELFTLKFTRKKYSRSINSLMHCMKILLIANLTKSKNNTSLTLFAYMKIYSPPLNSILNKFHNNNESISTPTTTIKLLSLPLLIDSNHIEVYTRLLNSNGIEFFISGLINV